MVSRHRLKQPPKRFTHLAKNRMHVSHAEAGIDSRYQGQLNIGHWNEGERVNKASRLAMEQHGSLVEALVHVVYLYCNQRWFRLISKHKAESHIPLSRSLRGRVS
jgi:hypothetical protein